MIQRSQQYGHAGRRAGALGPARAIGLFVLLMGVLIMHAVVFGTGHAMGAAEHPAGAHETAAAATTMPTADPAGLRPGTRVHQNTMAGHEAAHHASGSGLSSAMDDVAGCGLTHAMHACVFILAVLTLMAGLAVFGWVGPHRNRPDAPGAGGRPARYARPPPWSVLSLAELSILRI